MSTFDAGLVNEVNQETIENQELGFPNIMFLSGDLKLANKNDSVEARGGWFIAADSIDTNADLTGAGWKKESFTTNDGQEIEGWAKSTMEMMLIASRRRWSARDRSTAFPWRMTNAQKEEAKNLSITGHQQSIVLVRGLEDMGPFVIGLYGHKGMSFAGDAEYKTRGGAVSTFRSTVIEAANRASKAAGSKKKWDDYAFYLHAGAPTDAKGKAVFTKVGKGETTSLVLPVGINMPTSSADVDLNEFFVGRELMAIGAELKAELIDAGWTTAWNTAEGMNSDEAEKAEEAEEVIDDEALEEAGL